MKKKIKLLIADESEKFQRLLTEQLNSSGYTPTCTLVQTLKSAKMDGGPGEI